MRMPACEDQQKRKVSLLPRSATAEMRSRKFIDRRTRRRKSSSSIYFKSTNGSHTRSSMPSTHKQLGCSSAPGCVRACVCACLCVYVCACARACVRACAREHACRCLQPYFLAGGRGGGAMLLSSVFCFLNFWPSKYLDCGAFCTAALVRRGVTVPVPSDAIACGAHVEGSA